MKGTGLLALLVLALVVWLAAHGKLVPLKKAALGEK